MDSTDTTTSATATAPGTKSPMQSMTITGALIATTSGLEPVILNALGFTTAQEQAIVAATAALGTVIGGVMAIIGRMRATKKIA